MLCYVIFIFYSIAHAPINAGPFWSTTANGQLKSSYWKRVKPWKIRGWQANRLNLRLGLQKILLSVSNYCMYLMCSFSEAQIEKKIASKRKKLLRDIDRVAKDARFGFGLPPPCNFCPWSNISLRMPLPINSVPLGRRTRWLSAKRKITDGCARPYSYLLRTKQVFVFFF